MSFASPAFFWVLLSLIPLIAIYFLKVKPTVKPTTAFFLWEDIFQEKKATSLFQRFRDLLSLLLMVMAFLAIVFALVRPDFSGDNQKDLVLLIDNSASMNTIDGGSTRLQQAKRIASQIVQGLNGTQRCSIATVSNEAVFYSNLTDNPRLLLDSIAKIQPSSFTSNATVLRQFQFLKDSELSSRDTENDNDASQHSNNFRVILISDGCLGPVLTQNETEAPFDGIEFFKVGTSNPGNAGIVACDMQRLPGGNDRVGVFYQIHSTFSETVDAELILSHGTKDTLVKLLPLQLKPGVNDAEVFELENAASGKWFLDLQLNEKPDSLVDDNVAFMALPPRRPIPISVISEDRFFYENCVLAFSQANGLLTLVPGDSDPQPQLVIGTGRLPIAEESTSSLLIFQPTGESPWWSEVGPEIDVVLPRTLDESHPVIRHLDPTLLPFVGAKRLTVPSGAEVLVEAEDGTPLIFRATSAGRSALVVNLDPLASDFYLSAWFPVLVYSATVHLAGRSETIRSSYPAGQFVTIPGVQSGQATVVMQPDDSRTDTTEKVFGPLRQTGFYNLKNEGGDWQVASSLLSVTETDVDNSDVRDSRQPVNRGLSPALWMTLLAILVVVAESILYQRRKVG